MTSCPPVPGEVDFCNVCSLQISTQLSFISTQDRQMACLGPGRVCSHLTCADSKCPKTQGAEKKEELASANRAQDTPNLGERVIRSSYGELGGFLNWAEKNGFYTPTVAHSNVDAHFHVLRTNFLVESAEVCMITK